MKWQYNDGGRSQYYKAERVGDCVCRAIAIGTGMDYKEVHDLINKKAKGTSKKCSARNGVNKDISKQILRELGWVWHPTMVIGSGCKMHMRETELPTGTIIVKLSHHLCCVKDRVIQDTYDCSRDGSRCVYGYWTKA